MSEWEEESWRGNDKKGGSKDRNQRWKQKHIWRGRHSDVEWLLFFALSRYGECEKVPFYLLVFIVILTCIIDFGKPIAC